MPFQRRGALPNRVPERKLRALRPIAVPPFGTRMTVGAILCTADTIGVALMRVAIGFVRRRIGDRIRGLTPFPATNNNTN